MNYSWQGGTQFNIYQDYWEHGSGKPGIEYEGMYDHFWTGTWGARLQGWLAFLNGMYGYGYGSAKIWSANETPGIWAGAIQQKIDDGLEQLTYQDMDISWQESLNLPAAAQLGYMKQFFSQYEWWNLTPCFSSNEIFESYMGGKTGDEFRYSAAHIGTDLYMAYFYNIGMDSGAFKGLQKGTYVCKWFDPCTGEYRDEHERKIDSKGLMEIGDKPNNGDWVFIAEYLPGSSGGASSGGGFTAWIVAGAALLVAAAASVLLILRSKKRRKQRGGI